MDDTAKLHLEEKNGYIWAKLLETVKRDFIQIIQAKIESSMASIKKDIVIDLSNLDLINSTTINLFMNLQRECSNNSSMLHIVNVSKRCLMQLESVNLDKTLNIFEFEEELVQART